jgi:ferredoxin
MPVTSLTFLVTGAAVFLLLGAFAAVSIREMRSRAVAVSGIGALIFAAVWFGAFFILSPNPYILAIPVVIILIGAVLFFIPGRAPKSINIGEITERVDERDIMFAREEYHQTTDKHEVYYRIHPEYIEIDEKIRQLPELMAPGARYYDPIRSSYTEAIFRVIRTMVTEVDGEIESSPRDVEPQTMTASIKQMARHLGADEIGIARLNPMYVYSHVGRGPESWGTPIVNNHKYAIMFTLEMDYSHVEAAPDLPITEESAAKYLDGAMISLALARYVRELGYPARAHISGSNYQIMLPPVAYDAGLGELGRHGYLISPKFGARVRLGGVTTDLPLVPDKPIAFGVQNFCEICLRCADNCPSASIPSGGKTTVRGVEKWPLGIESCFRYWRLIGSDCGLCMKVCPFSHPPSFLHNLVRAGIKNSAFARRISMYGEDLFYGKKVNF